MTPEEHKLQAEKDQAMAFARAVAAMILHWNTVYAHKVGFRFSVQPTKKNK
jgi:hypothetical protein